ncbi:MAG TPA: hypothetical protein IAA79_04005 [Candidatus Avirikenella pullistercoris]|nr:hypothetical protein [Candidatus Avirikenella pullistercoris]
MTQFILFLIVAAIIMYSNRMMKRWNDLGGNNSGEDKEEQPEEDSGNIVLNMDGETDEEERDEERRIYVHENRLPNTADKQYERENVFLPASAALYRPVEVVPTETDEIGDIIAEYDYDNDIVQEGNNEEIMKDFSLRKAIIYSEIINPKYH